MKRALLTLLPVVVLLAGIATAVAFIKTAPKTQKKAAKAEITLVDVVVAERSRRSVDVDGMGTVVAARAVAIKSEVAGRVMWVSPNLVPGGRLKQNDLLFRIDDRDYKLAVEQQSSQVQRARFELAQEQGRVRVADREWKLLGDSAPTTPEGESLARRVPQLKSAQASLSSAESGLSLAKLNVKRTKVRAPFNAFVQSEQVEVGQLVDRQANLGNLVGTDEFWVQVSLPVSDLRWVSQPDGRGRGGSKATVVQTLTGGEVIEREGRVMRLVGDLDPKGRMARLVVAVKNPMDGPEGQLPLLLGAYVQVRIHGKKLDQVVVLPRRAVHAGDEVWVMTEDDTLGLKKANVIVRGPNEVYVKGGVETGDRIVVSRLITPVEGMPLRLPNAEEERTAAAPEGTPQ